MVRCRQVVFGVFGDNHLLGVDMGLAIAGFRPCLSIVEALVWHNLETGLHIGFIIMGARVCHNVGGVFGVPSTVVGDLDLGCDGERRRRQTSEEVAREMAMLRDDREQRIMTRTERATRKIEPRRLERGGGPRSSTAVPEPTLFQDVCNQPCRPMKLGPQPLGASNESCRIRLNVTRPKLKR